MLDPRSLPEEELLSQARAALKARQYEPARDFFGEYCGRFADARMPVPPGVIASYALARGHMRELKAALDMCRRALSADRSNPYIHACLAELYLLAGSRRQAVEAVRRGLATSPDYPVLLRLRQEMGVRQRPAIGFLSRGSRVNIALGRARRKIRSGPRSPRP